LPFPIVDREGNIALPEGPDIILTTGPLVGLGDHCIYTTLPKRFSELGYTVYVDKDNAARNDEIMELLWRRNPYIKGLSDKKPNVGYARQGLFYEVANRFPHDSIAAMERAHGLPPPYSIAPYINYQPKKSIAVDLSERVLIDFSAVSSGIQDEGIEQFLRAMKGKFRNPQFLLLTMPKWVALHLPQVGAESIQITSIYQYLDALSECRAWVGSEGGGQSLAAAVRGEHRRDEYDVRPEVSVLMTPPTFNDMGYVYAGVDYRVTRYSKDRADDWHFPHEMDAHVYALNCAASLDKMRSRA
jgi:hypothetical protein